MKFFNQPSKVKNIPLLNSPQHGHKLSVQNTTAFTVQPYTITPHPIQSDKKQQPIVQLGKLMESMSHMSPEGTKSKNQVKLYKSAQNTRQFNEVESQKTKQFQTFIHSMVGTADNSPKRGLPQVRESQTVQEARSTPNVKMRIKRLKQPVFGQLTQINMIGAQKRDKKDQLDSERERFKVMNELLTYDGKDVQDLITSDKEKIEVYNKTRPDERLSSPPQKSPERRQVLVSPLRKLKRRQTSVIIQGAELQGQVLKVDNESDSFSKTKQLGLEQIREISNEDYNKVLKGFHKHKNFSELYGQQSNVYMSLIESSYQNNLLPKRMSIIQDVKQISTVDARTVLSRKSSERVFQSGIKSPQCQNVKVINVGQNGLQKIDLKTFLKNFPHSTEELSLHSNKIDCNQIQPISDFLKQSHIRLLNLENNNIGDNGAKKLLNCLVENRTLKYLNLSKNNLTSQICEPLSAVLKKNTYLTELYLHYNNINQSGGAIIFKTLTKNSTLRVLDFSYNCLGNQSNFAQQSGTLKQVFLTSKEKKQAALTDCCINISKVLEKSTDLIHLDISYNQFTRPETIEIARALKANQNIFGFHYEGNDLEYVVDIHGFLRPIDEPQQEEIQIIEALSLKNQRVNVDQDDDLDDQLKMKCQNLMNNLQPDIDEIKQNHRFRKMNGVQKVERGQQFRNQKNLDTCWICEGWQEVKFVWKPQKSGDMFSVPIFIHLDFDGFRPLLMQDMKDEFFLYVMVPPDCKVQYFFTNPVLGIQTVAKEQLINQQEVEEFVSPRNMQFLYNGNILVEGQFLRQVNYMFTPSSQQIIDAEKNYSSVGFTVPRQERVKFDFSPYLNNRENIWRVEASIFNNYQADNAALINECFEFDFNSSKIARLVKEGEADQVKETLRGYYPYMFTIYKLYASNGSLQNLPCITMNSFNDFISQTNIMDGRIRSTDIDVNFISSNGKDLKYPQVYERALVRYQFLEILVRISIDKYFKAGLCKSINSSIIRVFEDDGVICYLKEFDTAQQWRDERFWNESCDNILKSRLPFLKVLFKYTCKLNPKTKFYKQMWASAKDFRDMLNQAQLIVEIFSERDCYLSYLLSMTTQVDELFQSRHYQMNFFEFIEGIARVAEKVSFAMPKPPSGSNIVDYPYRKELNLDEKLDGMIHYLYYKLGDQIKKEFQGQSDDDIIDMDVSVLGIKRAKLKLLQATQIQQTPMIQVRAKNPLVKQISKKSFATPVKKASEQYSSSSQSSLSESDDSFQGSNEIDMQLQEYLLQNQLKTQNNLQVSQNANLLSIMNSPQIGAKRLNAIVRGGKGKQTSEKNSSFNLMNVVNYFKKKNQERNQDMPDIDLSNKIPENKSGIRSFSNVSSSSSSR